MEKVWILYAIGGLLAAGIMDFNKKLVLMRWYSAEVYLLTSTIFFFCFFWGYTFLYGDRNFYPELILQWTVYGFSTFLIPLGMITAYKYSSVSFSLVTIRLIASFFLLLVWVFVIWDQISFWNIIGFIFWMFAIFLLSWWKKGDMWDIHIKGVIGMGISIWAIVFAHSFFKYVVTDVNIPDFTAVQNTSALFSVVSYLTLRKKWSRVSFIDMRKVFKYALVSGTLFPIFALYLLPNIYTYGPLSLGYKILSYSIIIPILLSIIFYKEAVNRTRIIAFVLTIVSIFLFLV